MRVLLASVGSPGDVNPFLAIGRALVARGHDVTALLNPTFAESARALGFDVEPVGTEHDYARLMSGVRVRRGLASQLAAWGEVLRLTPEHVAASRRAIERTRPDIVLRHYFTSGVRWACEEAGVPHVVAVLSPALWLSIDEDLAFGNRVIASIPSRAARRAAFRASLILGRGVLHVFAERRLDRYRNAHGFPPERRLLEKEWRGGRAILGLWSPALRPSLPDDPPRSTICGTCWYDAPHADDDSHLVSNFLDAGAPPIVFTVGTYVAQDPGTFFSAAIDACRRLGQRGLLLGGSGRRTVSLPEDVLWARYAPLSSVLPRSSLVVHHGGIGTTAEVLRSGRPMVVVPVTIDQPYTASLLERRGVAVVIRGGRVSGERLARAIETVARDASIPDRARGLAASLREEDGAGRAASVLETITLGERAPA